MCCTMCDWCVSVDVTSCVANVVAVYILFLLGKYSLPSRPCRMIHVIFMWFSLNVPTLKLCESAWMCVVLGCIVFIQIMCL